MAGQLRTLVGKDAPVKPGTIRRRVPAEFPEFSSDEEELPAVPRIGGNFRPHVCENEEPQPSQGTPSQPSWADLHPELAAKSSGGPIKDTAVVIAYREDLAQRERAGKRKAEEVTANSLKVLKRRSFLLFLKTLNFF